MTLPDIFGNSHANLKSKRGKGFPRKILQSLENNIHEFHIIFFITPFMHKLHDSWFPIKKKVKLSLCLTTYHAMKTYGGTSPHIVNLGTRWR
jgi:hypothetical protein